MVYISERRGFASLHTRPSSFMARLLGCPSILAHVAREEAAAYAGGHVSAVAVQCRELARDTKTLHPLVVFERPANDLGCPFDLFIIMQECFRVVEDSQYAPLWFHLLVIHVDNVA